MLDARGTYDVVVCWAIDRLARNVLDFLNADVDLQKFGAAVTSVKDSIDMTSPTGRAFATMLAVFAEIEAANISARQIAARAYLINDARVVGGDLPFFLEKVPNPNGKGYVARPRTDFVTPLQSGVAGILSGDQTVSGICPSMGRCGVACAG